MRICVRSASRPTAGAPHSKRAPSAGFSSVSPEGSCTTIVNGASTSSRFSSWSTVSRIARCSSAAIAAALASAWNERFCLATARWLYSVLIARFESTPISNSISGISIRASGALRRTRRRSALDAMCSVSVSCRRSARGAGGLMRKTSRPSCSSVSQCGSARTKSSKLPFSASSNSSRSSYHMCASIWPMALTASHGVGWLK
mmetsp:Transcript_14097/g.44034  ORF Transcript_14097/g.44034 Transcript_14097/m.44034 type:complete len:202 (-) Transcript_14097:147-752(-)